VNLRLSAISHQLSANVFTNNVTAARWEDVETGNKSEDLPHTMLGRKPSLCVQLSFLKREDIFF
jgi:hypothetical protein